MNARGLLAAAALLLLSLAGLNFGCADNQAAEITIELTDTDPQVVLGPGYPAVMRGSTLVVQGYNSAPVIRSYPIYAGVDNPTELGIGSAAGFDPDDGFILPINANLADKAVKSYEFLLILDYPDRLQLTQISGSDPTLEQRFPAQYDPANGFSAPPSVVNGATAGYFYISATGTSSADGRINLARLKFRILKHIPDSGVTITFQIVELLDASATDICAQFPHGCHPQNGIVARNFRIQK